MCDFFFNIFLQPLKNVLKVETFSGVFTLYVVVFWLDIRFERLWWIFLGNDDFVSRGVERDFSPPPSRRNGGSRLGRSRSRERVFRSRDRRSRSRERRSRSRDPFLASRYPEDRRRSPELARDRVNIMLTFKTPENVQFPSDIESEFCTLLIPTLYSLHSLNDVCRLKLFHLLYIIDWL